METLSIIIVNYNSTDCAIELLDSIDRTRGRLNTEIVVIDNASGDKPQRIKTRFDEIRLFVNKTNGGFSKAVNFAIPKCTSPYLMIINPDVIINERFFSKVGRFLKKNPQAAILGPKIFDHDGSVQGSARRFPTALTSIFGRKSPLTSLFPNNPVTRKEFLCFHDKGGAVEVDWVSGACMVVKRDVFNTIGGFDERFFLYWEDTDFCKRAKDAGFKIVYYPEASIMHTVGKSSSFNPIASICHFHNSCFKLVCKHTHSCQRLFIPFAFLGLFVRCLLAILLNTVTSRVNSAKNKPFNHAKPSDRVELGG